MTRPANWQALRQRLRPCLIATALMTLFLGVWQFLVPGDDTNSSTSSLTAWAEIVAIWVSFPNSIVLAASASRSLWRERHRAAALVPVPGLLAGAVGLPVLVEWVGLGRAAALWAFPAALLISAGVSVAVIVRAPLVVAATRERDDDEPQAYARDVVQRRPKGDSR